MSARPIRPIVDLATDDRQHFTLGTVALYAGTDIRTVKKWIANEKLTAHKWPDDSWRVKKCDLIELEARIRGARDFRKRRDPQPHDAHGLHDAHDARAHVTRSHSAV
jgi:hypothetical protein